MKILEAQSAVLTNYEVWKHARDMKDRGKKDRRRNPGNHMTVMQELRTWLEMHPSPLSQKPMPYKPKTIPTLLERLRPYDLSKGEAIMIMNLRPTSVPALSVIVEDIGERFTEEQVEEIMGIIIEVLGEFPPPPEAEEEDNGDAPAEEDVTMQDGEAPAEEATAA